MRFPYSLPIQKQHRLRQAARPVGFVVLTALIHHYFQSRRTQALLAQIGFEILYLLHHVRAELGSDEASLVPVAR